MIKTKSTCYAKKLNKIIIKKIDTDEKIKSWSLTDDDSIYHDTSNKQWSKKGYLILVEGKMNSAVLRI